MRSLTALLLLASLAAAIPLRKGASLGYKVWRGWESDSTFATLTVLDSIATDTGTLWKVGIRDSLIGGQRIRLDTATLWVRGDTDTVWLVPSCLAAWDPAPRRVETASGSGTSSPLAYGQLAGACFPNGWGTAVSTDSSGWKVPSIPFYTLNGNRRTFGDGLSVFWFSTPQTGWIPDTGWGKLSDTVSREDWKLVDVDGRVATSPRIWDTTATLLTQMQPGESWTWEATERDDYGLPTGTIAPPPSSTTYLVHWTVTSAPSDSAGWIRRTIMADTSMDLRINLASGSVVLSRKDNLSSWLADGMLRIWSDSAQPGSEWARSLYTGEGSSENAGGSFDSLIEMIRSGIGTDELIQGTFHNDILGSSWSKSLHALLLIHDSDTIRTTSLSAPRLQARTPPLASLSSLRLELTTHPTSIVRVTDLSGRTHAFPASEAMLALPSLHGVVLVEVREGTVALRGRLFLP